MKILHTADFQLNANKYDECIKMLDAIIDCVKSNEPDMIIIAGDVFDNRQQFYRRSMVLPAMEFIRTVSDFAPVVIIKGNEMHDADGSIEPLAKFRGRYPVWATERIESVLYFDSTTVDPGEERFIPVRDLLNDRGEDEAHKAFIHASALIHCIPYPEKGHLLAQVEEGSIEETDKMAEKVIENIIHGFREIGKMVTCPRILTAHLNTFGAKLSNGTEMISGEVTILPDILYQAEVDYIALGHNHKMQQVCPNGWFSGSTRHVTHGEKERKATLLVTVNRGQEPDVFDWIMPSIPIIEYDFQFTPEKGWLPIEDVVGDEDQEEWVNAHLKIKAKIRAEDSKRWSEEELRGHFEGLFPGAESYKIERITLPDIRVRESRITKVQRLRDKLTVYAESIGREDIAESLLEKADKIEDEYGRIEK